MWSFVTGRPLMMVNDGEQWTHLSLSLHILLMKAPYHAKPPSYLVRFGLASGLRMRVFFKAMVDGS